MASQEGLIQEEWSPKFYGNYTQSAYSCFWFDWFFSCKAFPLQVTSSSLGCHSWFVCWSIPENLGRCLQSVRKLNSPKCRIESIMDIFLHPIIFLIWAAISILFLLRVIFSVHMAKCTVNFSVGILYESLQWTLFLSWLAISSWLGRYLLSFIQVFFIILITIYTFVWGVYDSGPKSCRRSFFDILCNPVPGIEFKEILCEADDFKTLWHWQFNHNIVACWVARNKRLNVMWNTRSIASTVHDSSLISTLMLHKFMGINLILLWMIIWWAREEMKKSIAYQWWFTLLFAFFVSGYCFPRLTKNTT